MKLKNAFYFLLPIILFASGLFIGWFLLVRNFSNTDINTSRVSVIKEIRNLQRIETASFTIEKIIDAGTSGNVFQQLLFGDKILLIAHGQVIAGFDLSQIPENDIEITGKNITVTLPKPQILITTLDNAQTRVYDRTRGILNPGDINLEAKAREAAQNSIQEAACTGNILKQASDNARKQLSAFFSTLGFIQITINIPDSSC